jgi:hypothetical protein
VYAAIRLLALLLALAASALSCAHGPGAGGEDPRATVDVRLPGGGMSTLRAVGGKITVLDVCAGWSAPCVANARAMSEACDVVCGEDVGVVTMLLDEEAETAVQSYREVLGVSHTVVLPGPRTLAGQTALGNVLDIPRIVIFAPDGRVIEDEVGGVVSAVGIVKRVRDLQ